MSTHDLPTRSHASRMRCCALSRAAVRNWPTMHTATSGVAHSIDRREGLVGVIVKTRARARGRAAAFCNRTADDASDTTTDERHAVRVSRFSFASLNVSVSIVCTHD